MTTATKEQLAEFKRLKAIVTKDAIKTIADNIKQIKDLLTEVKELAELTGADVSVQDLHGYVENIEVLHSDWSSSSYNC